MICCDSSTVPSCPFTPGEEAKPSGHCAQHQPSTWAKRQTDNDKGGIQVEFGQSRQDSQAHTNAEGSLLLHLLLVTLLLSAGQIFSDVSFSAPTWGEHPSSSQAIMHPCTISLGAPETGSDSAFPSCSLCCHLQPHDSPRGLAWAAHPRGTHLIWDAGLSLFSCRTPHRWLNNAWAVISFRQFTFFFFFFFFCRFNR